MRLKKFDLNLLVVLDALLTEQNVTRAAQRVNLSQPAVSAALARLRAYFQDELLMQVGRTLTPTPLGLRLAGQVRNLLIDAEAALETSQGFDPASHTRNFRLMAAGYVSVVLIAELIKRCHHSAPNVTFEISPPEFWRAELVDKGDVDLLVTPQDQVSVEHPHELLFVENFMCIAAQDNPLISAGLDISQYLQLGHVVSPVGRQTRMLHPIDQWLLKEYNAVRRIEVAVADFHAIPHFVIGTHRIATIHERLARRYAQILPLRLLPPPLPVAPLNIAMQWNTHLDSDSGLQWLRTQLKATAAEWWQ